MSKRSKKFDNTKRGLVSEKEIEQQVIYTEKILQPQVIVKSGVFAREQGERTVEISPIFGIYFPANEVVEIEGEGDNFLLQRAGKNLSISLDPEDERTISIGSSDYRLNREGKLIEVDVMAFALLPPQKPNSKAYQLVRDESGRFVIDLRLIQGNEKITQFFAK